MWALIQNGSVAEITGIDPADRFHPELLWEACAEDVEVGWQYDGADFSAPSAAESVVPQTCTPAQGLIALFALKRITETEVLTAIGSIPDDDQRYTAQIGYQRATVWDRSSPTMQSMAQLLQLSEEDLDALYFHAVTVQV